MKILAFRDGLRDPRNERVAQIASNMGYDVEFLGIDTHDKALPKSYFSKIQTIKIRGIHRSGILNKNFLNNLREVIEDIDPDIIYAHDILFAKMIYQIKPNLLIMDDHEYWTEQIKYFRVNFSSGMKGGIKSFLSLNYLKQKIPKWQKQIQQNAVIVASSNQIKKKHELDGAKNVFYFPNMPTLDEVKSINMKRKYEDDLYSSFVGRDMSISTQRAYRNTKGLRNIFEDGKIGKLMVLGDDNLKNDNHLLSKGFLSHMKCYEELSRTHVGLLGFKSHPALGFKSAQKVHMYVHSGITPFVTPEQYNLLTYLQPMMLVYKDFMDLREKILKEKKVLFDKDNKSNIEWARKNLVLDNYKHNLKNAFDKIC